jgi:hypothetical protein
MALFRVAMKWCMDYYADTGTMIGSNLAASTIAEETGFEWDEDDIAECCERIMGS